MAVVFTPPAVTIKCYPSDVTNVTFLATYTSINTPPVFSASADSAVTVRFEDTPTVQTFVGMTVAEVVPAKILVAGSASYGPALGEPGYVQYAPFDVVPPAPNPYGWALVATHNAIVDVLDSDAEITQLSVTAEYYIPGSPPPASSRYAIWGEADNSFTQPT